MGKVVKECKTPLRDAAAVNAVRSEVWRRLTATGLPIETGSGGRTKFNRLTQGYPKEHWIHLRTTNPIESIFSGVRLRTDAARRIRRRDNALYLVFKIVQRLSRNWRSLNGGANLMALVLEGCTFKDGILQREKMPELVGVRS